MATSINGWSVVRPGQAGIKTYYIPGTKRKIQLRATVAPLLLALAAEYNKKIAPIEGGTFDDWGYAYREARMANAFSDHSSGTAMDLNATKEGRMGRGPYNWWKSSGRYLKAKALKRKYAHVIWGGSTQLGGDYRNAAYWDWMHWAIKPGTRLSDVEWQINKLGIKPNGELWAKRPVVSARYVKPNARNSHSLTVKKALKRRYPDMKIDLKTNLFGPTAQAAWKRWERECGFSPADGTPGMLGLIKLGNLYGFLVTT